MHTLIKTMADRLVDLSANIGAIGLIVEVLIILIDVVGRFFGYPLTGAQDVSQMVMVIVVFGGMALCDRLGGHIAVDIFENAFSVRFNKWLNVFSALIGAVIFAAMAWTIYESSKLSQMLNLATNIIQLPKAYFQWALVGFAGITAIAMLVRAVELTLGSADALAEKEEVLQ